jgi:hypothetical protein
LKLFVCFLDGRVICYHLFLDHLKLPHSLQQHQVTQMTPLNVGRKTCVKSNDTDLIALTALAKPVKKVTIQAEEDLVDQLLELTCNESIISLGPLDLSKSTGLNDLHSEGTPHVTTIDPDWLWLSMNFDDQALELSASFSTLSIAPSLPKPSAALERSTSKDNSQPAA